jgi:heme/copper-type cytochrome/quinol oxidase subunit 2
MAQPAPSTAAPSAGDAPASAPSAVVVRPPEGTIERGKYEAPPWLIGLAAGVLVAAVVVFFVIRHRRDRKKKSYESITPPSSRSPVSSRR